MLADWFCGGGFVKARLMEVAELILSYLCLVSEGIPGVQLVDIEYCGWAMEDM